MPHERDMLAYAYHSGKRSAYANAGMHARAREHAHLAQCARFGSSKRPRAESPTRGTPAGRERREELRKEQIRSEEPTEKNQSWSEWFWGTSAPAAAAAAAAPEADREARVPVANGHARYACAGKGRECTNDAVYAFAPCDHPLLCELHFRNLSESLSKSIESRTAPPGATLLADFLPKCASGKTCKDDSSAECCTVRRNPMVARKLDAHGGNTYVTTSTTQRVLLPFRQRTDSIACGPCVNGIQHGTLKVCDRPKRATAGQQCAPLTSEELGRFYRAVMETWRYGAWITPQSFEWGTGWFGPGT
jgi:hypothetical protein